MNKILLKIAIKILANYFDFVDIGKDPDSKRIASIYFGDLEYSSQLIESLRKGDILRGLKDYINSEKSN